eukprot:scaffold16688_cov143-Skeletonema_marinoi.AAC.2
MEGEKRVSIPIWYIIIGCLLSQPFEKFVVLHGYVGLPVVLHNNPSFTVFTAQVNKVPRAVSPVLLNIQKSVHGTGQQSSSCSVTCSSEHSLCIAASLARSRHPLVSREL